MSTISIKKHLEDIQRFTLVQGLYKNYADILKKILERAVDLYAPLGVVQARPKSIGSFSEKIIRKDKYLDPLSDITDLCGARTIVHFASQVETICQFIRDNFEIDEINSVDVKTRLKVSEFGYRSVHYIVTPNRQEILGVPIPKEIRELKAEIQVRTFNEHVWADILHDRIYKTKINVPSRWQRESARLAAMLEEIDNAFYTISGTLDQFSVNYRPTPSQDKLNNEISVLNTLIDINPEYNDKTIGNYLKLAVLYNMLGKWSEIIDLLTPVYKSRGKITEVLWKGRTGYELGYALCLLNRNNINDSRFKQGLKLVEEALELFGNNPFFNLDIAKASFYMAKLYDLAGTKRENCNGLASRARRFSPENPYYLLNAIVENLGTKDNIQPSDIDRIIPQLQQIIVTCREHIEMGIESPDACIAISLCFYLMGNETASIEYLILLLQMVNGKEVPISPEIVYDGVRLFSKVAAHQKSLVQAGILHVIGFKALNLEESKAWLKSLRGVPTHFSNEVLIIAGKSSQFSREETKEFSPYLEKALGSFEGTVISGGTDSGLPGLASTITAKLNKNNSKHFTLIGYLPEKNKSGIRVGKAYDKLRTSTGDGFSFNEVLLYWADIILNDVPTEKILLLGINGGPISEQEYTFALSMGARVVLLQHTGGAVDAVAFHKRWSIQPNLILLPADPDTLWALVCMNRKSMLDKGKVEMLARTVHTSYRNQRLRKFPASTSNIDDLKVVMLWKHLDPKLIISNIKQVEFYEHLLKRVGLGIRISRKPAIYPIHLNKLQFEQMARLEHSRWNAERLLAGWRYGAVKNIEKKINPCIVEWDELNKDTKKYDYKPIKNMPLLLAKAGYEIYKLKK